MDRPRLIRGLRIAWNAAWGIVCVLLLVLWARSYRGMDVRELPRIDIVIADGSLFVNERFTFNEGPASVGYVAAGDGFKIPLWLPTLFAAALAAIPWVGRQYSVRTLLIATTLIAVLLGLVVVFGR